MALKRALVAAALLIGAGGPTPPLRAQQPPAPQPAPAVPTLDKPAVTPPPAAGPAPAKPPATAPTTAPATAPTTAPTTAPADGASTADVRAFGAKGDGAADDTEAFRAAIAAVAQKGGVVTVPAGEFLIKTHLDVAPGVTIEGVWRSPRAKGQRLGTTLLAVEGAGAETGAPFISLGANATLKGVTVFYPDQKTDKITAYPWCVAATGENVSVVDCLLLNPFQGLDLAGKPSGRHYVRNLYGQPLRRGISVDKCFDVGRIENVHFGPFWNWDDKVQAWQTANGEAFTFARSDWQYVQNVFCYGYRVGYRFIKSADGATNGNLLGIGADATHNAVSIEATQGPALLIGNGQFVSFTGDKPTQVVVADAHAGVVQFQNCAFWGLSHQVARIAGTGTVAFNNCNFVEWSNGVPAIDLSGGNLIVNACVFQKPFPQAVLQNKAESAVITSNRFAGPASIANPANAALQAGLNVEKKAPQ
jgi:hypothetical protein